MTISFRVICGVALAAFAAASAVAERKVTDRVREPWTPAGYVLEETSDCEIAGGRDAPGAFLSCAPGLGWRLMTTDGAVVFPKGGYLQRDAEWAFPGSGTAVFLSRNQIEIVSLPGGETRRADFNNLAEVRGARGLPVLAVTWKAQGWGSEDAQPIRARLVGADGEIGEPLEASDMRGVLDARGLHACWSAVILAGIAVEKLPNSAWGELKRDVGDADSALTCGPYLVPALAGRDAQGWHVLDPGSLEPVGPRVFASASEAFASARGD